MDSIDKNKRTYSPDLMYGFDERNHSKPYSFYHLPSMAETLQIEIEDLKAKCDQSVDGQVIPTGIVDSAKKLIPVENDETPSIKVEDVEIHRSYTTYRGKHLISTTIPDPMHESVTRTYYLSSESIYRLYREFHDCGYMYRHYLESLRFFYWHLAKMVEIRVFAPSELYPERVIKVFRHHMLDRTRDPLSAIPPKKPDPYNIRYQIPYWDDEIDIESLPKWGTYIMRSMEDYRAGRFGTPMHFTAQYMFNMGWYRFFNPTEQKYPYLELR